MKRLTLLSVFALTLSVTTICSAQTRSPFDLWDKDGDDQVDRTEIPASIRANFNRADTDRDGFISRDEDRAFRQRAAESRQNATRPGQQQQRPDNSEVRERIELKTDISYVESDDPRQMLDLYLPKERESDEPLPLIVWIHGGGWRNGSKSGAIGRIGEYVASGRYVGASINYRLSDRGPWPIQIHDCKAAIRWLRAHADEYGVDPDRIAVWGSSAGGHLVAMMGTSGDVPEIDGKLGKHTGESSRVTCVVDYFGPTEFLSMNHFDSTMDHDAENSPESLLCGGPIHEMRDVVKSASPLTYVTKDDPPILIVHGTADSLVPIDQSVQLNTALKKADVDVTFIRVEGAGHGNGLTNNPAVQRRVHDFFERHLYDVKVELKSETVEAN